MSVEKNYSVWTTGNRKCWGWGKGILEAGHHWENGKINRVLRKMCKPLLLKAQSMG
jgi:hypothetical protein